VKMDPPPADMLRPFLLNFRSKDRYFRPFSLDYHTHKQFRCVNISRMAGFQFPSSLVIRAKLVVQENDRYLIENSALSEW
jgi:hypothetical protein